MGSKYLIVISFDAVSSHDIKFLRTLPNFSKLILNGSIITEVETIYPSLTYPAHTTIVTGRYPCNHGVINNSILRVNDSNPPWYFYRKYIKGETLYDLAKEKGLKTSSILWPVTGRSSIDYNMPEIFCTKPWENQIIKSALAGSVSYQYNLNKKFGNIRKGISQPYLDDFAMECAKYTIENYKPNLLLLHLCHVDSHRHVYGYDSKEAMEGLLRHDERLGRIISSLEKAGIYEESTIVALGDHSALNCSNVIRLNVLLKENNLITVDKNGKIVDYKAVGKSCDGCSYIYIKEKKDIDSIKKVKQLLIELIDNNYIEGYMDSKKANEIVSDENCAFIVEAALGYYFLDDIYGDIVEEICEEDFGNKAHRYRATHGYSPKKENYSTFFIASGVGVKSGVEIHGGQLINHGPTLAKLLGINLTNSDGKIVSEILDE